MLRKLFFTIITFALVFGLTACGETDEPSDSAVDPVFREFYELLGGQDVLGPVISIMYQENDKKLQFTTSVLTIFDPRAPESGRYQLAPLGNAMKVAEPPLKAPNGHEIYPGFLPLFRQIGGSRFTGKPLTGVKAEPEHNRIVQYFENVGFYQLTSDFPDEAHLLHYGVWKCSYACNFGSPQESIVIPPAAPGYGIASAVERLDPQLTGFPLTEIYIAGDGNEEQIFENVVFYTEPGSPGGIALRPLPLILEIQQDKPEGAGQEEGRFIAVDRNKGFNVPYHIDEYIKRNYGYEFLGDPITNYVQISDDLYRQCFVNICLDYRPNEIDDLQIRPMALGRRYQQKIQNNSSIEGGINSFDAVTLTVWEQYPVISSAEKQEIHVMVLDNGNPLKNIDLTLNLSMPDGNQQSFSFSPTGPDGQTKIDVGSIDTSNGTLIIYQVCVENVQNGPDCISDDYLIWGNP